MQRRSPQFKPESIYPMRMDFLNKLKTQFETYIEQGFSWRQSLRFTACHIDSTMSDGQKYDHVSNATMWVSKRHQEMSKNNEGQTQ